MFADHERFDHLDEAGMDFLSSRRFHTMPPEAERIELFQEGRYTAYAYDLDFGWRWVLARDGQDIQEGAALCQEAALRSARQVLAFFTRIDDRHG
jgi:soluble methane monooxygenase-binding protein MmoD